MNTNSENYTTYYGVKVNKTETTITELPTNRDVLTKWEAIGIGFIMFGTVPLVVGISRLIEYLR